MRISAVSVEVLEVRQLMTETPLTEEEVTEAIEDAEEAVDDAQEQLDNAQTAYATQTTTAINGMNGAIDGLRNAAQLLIDGQTTLVQGLIDGAKTTLDGAVDGLNTALQGQLDGFQGQLDTDIDTAQQLRQSQFDAAKNQLTTDFNTIESGHDTAVTGLKNAHQGNIDSAKATFDAAVTTEESTFDTAVTGPGGFDDQFDGVVTSQTASFQSSEGSNWTSLYDNVIGTGPTGLQTLYGSAISTADSTLAGVLSANPTVVYDPSSVIGSSTFQSYVDGQVTQMLANLQLAVDAYQTNVNNRLTLLDTQINGPGGARAGYQGSLDGAEDTFELNADTANDQLTTDLQGDWNTYDQAVNGPTGFAQQIETNLNNRESTYNAAIVTAQGVFDSTMAGPKATLQSTIDTAVNVFEAWMNGTSGSLTETTTITEIPGLPPTYTITYTATDANSNTTTWTETSFVRPDALPPGVTSAGTTAIVSGNPYKRAMALRLDSLTEELEGLLNNFSILASNAQNILDAAILAANQQYWDNVFDPAAVPTSPYDGYLNTVTTANQTLNTALLGDYSTYQTEEWNYNLAVMTAMMNWMMGGMTGPLVLPDPAILDAAAKDYWVSASIDTALSVNTITGAWETFIGTAVAKDTIRQQAIVNALGVYATAMCNAGFALTLAEYQAIGDYETDINDLQHAFAQEAAQRETAVKNTAAAALNAYSLAEDGVQETFAQSAATALKNYKQGATADLTTYRTQEAAAWKTYQIDSAGHEKTWTDTMAGHVQTMLNGVALATKNFDQQVNSLENQAEEDLTGYDDAATQQFTGYLVTFASNIANQLATDVIAASGGDPGVTSVANAYAQNSIGKVQAAKNLTDGETAAFKGYADQTSDDRKAANDAIAAAAETRSNQVTGAFGGMVSGVGGVGGIAAAALAQVTTLAPQAEATANALAAQAQTSANDVADKEKIANDAVALADKTQADSEANGLFSFLSQTIAAVAANFPLVDNLQKGFEQFSWNQTLGLATFEETENHNADLGEITQRRNTALTLVAQEDALIIAQAHQMAVGQRAAAWNQVATYQGMAVSAFAGYHPSGPTPPPIMTMLPMVGRPVRPGTPPPPPPPAPNAQVNSDPFKEPEIGFMNGLKTGLKAIANSAVDTAAGVVSLGQWDPPDVWKVDPVSDIGYDGARVFADIGTNTALAAATGGLSGTCGRVGQVARVVERMDTAANLVNGVQGAYDVTQNGLNLQNGMQTAMGVMGGMQAKSVVQKQGQSFCFAPETLVSTADGQKQLKEVVPGEKVHAFDFTSGRWVLSTVQQRHENPYTGSLVTARIGDIQIEVTANHPFWVIEGERLRSRKTAGHLAAGQDEGLQVPGRWVNSQDIEIGDLMLCMDGISRRVEDIDQRPVEKFAVCNLTVESFHSFAVGAAAVLVHNDGFCDALETAGRGESSTLSKLAEVNGWNTHGHHIVQKTAPAGYSKIQKFTEIQEGWTTSQKKAWYIGKSQELLSAKGVALLDDLGDAMKAAKNGDTLFNLCHAINGNGTHALATVQAVYNKLVRCKTTGQVQNALESIAAVLEVGGTLF